MITVDVEAQPQRAKRDPIDRLIWGRFPQAREAGLHTIMRAAASHGYKVTTFLDYCEEHLYGTAILDVAREIATSGHEVQLHAHPDFLRPTIWRGGAATPTLDMRYMDAVQSKRLADFLLETHHKALDSNPLAFRGGGYRFGPEILRALFDRGVCIHSSYNPGRPSNQPLVFGLQKQFRWINGALEVPISCLESFQNYSRMVEFNFNDIALAKVEHLKSYLDQFYAAFGEDAIAVLVMHSWSLLAYDREAGVFVGPAPGAEERFCAFLDSLAPDIEVITPSTLQDLTSENGIAIRDFDGREANVPTAAPDRPNIIHLSTLVGECPLCSHALANKLADNANCPTCGSPARTRTFPAALDAAVAKAGDLGTPRRVLAFAPSGREVDCLTPYFGKITKASLYGRYGGDALTGVDIRQMPQLADASFEAVTGILLFDYFTEHEAALGEAFRVLSPGGLLLTHIAPYRLTDSVNPPEIKSIIKSRPGYFEYVPDDARMPSVELGRFWLIDAMRRTGFSAYHLSIKDAASEATLDWFLGIKSAPKVTAAKATAATLDASTEASQVMSGPAQDSKETPEGRCSICGNPHEKFVAFNEGSRRKCPSCGSVERQRAFADACRVALRAHFDLADKKVLHISASASETRVLNELGVREIVTLDIRPSLKPDIVADVTSMPQVPSGSFDAVVALYLLPMVHDLRATLSEIKRVLKPGGGYISVDPITTRGPILEERDLSVITRYYGEETFKAFRFGSFRRLGEAGLLEILGEYFETQAFHYVDQPTGAKEVVMLSLKRAELPSSVEGPTIEDPAGNVPATLGAIDRPILALPKVLSTPRSLEFVVPLSGIRGLKCIRTRVTEVLLPKELRYARFAEHGFDRERRRSTNELIVLGDNVIGYSDDMGESWSRIEVALPTGARLYNAFTTSSGNRLVQGLGWTGADDARSESQAIAPLLVFDSKWNLIHRIQTGSAHWHGSASIDEANGTIIYGEYQDNSDLYRMKLTPDHPEWSSRVRPNAIFRSVDGGVRWEKVFEQPANEIRHFHTVQADPYLPGTWWASSGDVAQENKVWRSEDDGVNWELISRVNPPVRVHASRGKSTQAAYRYTDVIIDRSSLYWGTDDYQGSPEKYTTADPIQSRVGSRFYRLDKVGLSIREVGYGGHPFRSIVDVGAGWLMVTEAKHANVSPGPQLFFRPKDEDHAPIYLFDLPRAASGLTGLTYSKASRAAAHGRFFSFKLSDDVFRNSSYVLRWDVSFD